MKTIFLAHIKSTKTATTFTIDTNDDLLTEDFIKECAMDALKENCGVTDDIIEQSYIKVENTKTNHFYEF